MRRRAYPTWNGRSTPCYSGGDFGALDELHGTALTLDVHVLSPPLLHKAIARRDLFDRGLRAIIQAGMAQGQFTPGDAKMAAFAMMGAVTGITTWFDPAGELSSDEIGRAFADYLIEGLRRK